MKKILYITGTRADYGLMRHTLKAIDTNSNLNLSIAVTGMHLMPEYGNTIKEIISDNFNYFEVPVISEGDTLSSMSLFIGKFITQLTEKNILP